MATERLILEVRTKGTRTVQRNLGRIRKEAAGANKTLALLRSTLVVVAGVRVISGFLALADTLTNISNRIKLVTNGAEQLSAVTKRLAQISIETRSEFESNAIIFNRLARSAVNLGLTFNDLLGLTRGLAQATAIAGATAQEARNSLIQFSQGLASGAVQGDELRSVAEQLPPIANAIAASFNKAGQDVQDVWGVSTEQLAEFGFVVGNISGGQLIAIAKRFEGILKAGPVLDALRDALGDFDDQFKLIDITVSQAFTNFQTRLVIFTGGLAKSIELGNLMNTVLTKIADNFELIGLAIATFVSLAVFNLLVGQVAVFGSTVLKVLGFLTSGFIGLAKIILLPFRLAIGGVVLFAKGAVLLTAAYTTAFVFIHGQILLLGTRFGLLKLAIIAGAGKAWVIARNIMLGAVAVMKAAILGIPVVLAIARRAVLATAGAFLVISKAAVIARGAVVLFATGTAAAFVFLKAAAAGFFAVMGTIAAVAAAGLLPILGIIAVLIGLFFAVKFAIEKVGGGLDNIVKNFKIVAGAASGLVDGIVESFTLLPGAIADLAIQAGNKLIDGIEFGVNGIIALLKSIGVDVDEVDLGRLENNFKDSAKKVKEILIQNIGEGVREGASNSKTFASLKNVFAKVKDLLSGGGLLGDLSAGEALTLEELANGEEIINAVNTAAKKAADSFDKLRASVDPYADLTLKLKDATETLDDALSKGVITQGQYDDTLKLIMQDMLGVKSVTFDLARQQKFLNEQVKLGELSAADASLAYRQFALDATQAFDQTLGAVFPLIQRTRELEEISVFLVKNQELLEKSGISAAEAQKRLAREAFGLGKTVEQVNEEIMQLIENQKLLGLTTEQVTFEVRKLRIAFLDTQRDAVSGAERSMLKFIEAASDGAAQTEKLFDSVFEGIADQLAKFVETGTFSFNEFFRNIAAQLIQLGTNQLLGSLLAGVSGGGGGLGGGGGIGGLITQGLGALFGAHRGAAFTVGSDTSVQSIPGIDNRLVAFRAQDGEDVTVTPKNASQGSVGPTNIVFNVQARDADSFKRSQSQLQNRLLAGIGQARRRR